MELFATSPYRGNESPGTAIFRNQEAPDGNSPKRIHYEVPRTEFPQRTRLSRLDSLSPATSKQGASDPRTWQSKVSRDNPRFWGPPKRYIMIADQIRWQAVSNSFQRSWTHQRRVAQSGRCCRFTGGRTLPVTRLGMGQVAVISCLCAVLSDK